MVEFSARAEVTQEPSAAEKPKSTLADYIRLTQSDSGELLSLDTAVISYRAADSTATVDLVGAVHIAEKSYYDELNRLFDGYDVLLYELVAPEGTVVTPDANQRSANPISFLQNATKSFLGMESQLDHIDYSKPHFVRADMTPEQIADKLKQRGESPLSLALSTLSDIMRQQSQALKEPQNNPLAASEMSLTEMLENPRQAKLLMAQQFATAGAMDQALGGRLNQLLVIDRNEEALRRLKEQLEAGHQKLGVFYGAAHLPDMDQRLITEFGMTRQETRWVKAWDLTTSTGQPLDPAKLLLDMLKQLQ